MSDMSYPSKEKSQFMNVQGGEKKVMKKILSVALSTAMAFSMFASVAFGETATTPQAKFDALAAKGILNGYPDGKSHLEKDLTRAEFAKIVTKLFGLPEGSTSKLSYKDKGYTAKNWAVPYIEAVTAAGLMQGQDTVKGIFGYNAKVTVEEVAAVLFRAMKLEQPSATDNSASVWAKGYAQAVIDAGLVEKNTNFKANATRSLVVGVAYAYDQKSTVPTLTVTSAEAVSPTKVVVTFSDKTTINVDLPTALVAGVEQTISFKHLEKDYTAKVTLQAPKVVSVTAPNAKQVVVKFNRAIDPDTLVETNTLIEGVVKVTEVGKQVDVAKGAKVVISDDATQATISLDGNTFLKGNYTVVINDTIRTTAGEAIPAFTQLLPVADVVAPTVVSVSSVAKTTTNKVYVKLSEPVKTAGLIAYVNGAAASVTRDTYQPLDEVTLTTGTLNSGTSYDVSLTNLSDYAGNLATPNPVKTTVTVSSDVQAPVVTKVTAIGDKTVEVVFNKAVDYNSLVGNVRLLDANGESKGVFTVNTTSDNKTFKLTSPLGSLPSTGTFSGSIVFGATVRDTIGNNLGTAVTQPITFTKDTVAPTVTGVTYKSGSGLVVKFSEEVNHVAGVKGLTLIKDSTGVGNAITSTPVKSKDGKSLTFATSGGVVGAHTLRLPEGLVTDASFAKNKLVATVVAITGDTTSSDSERPKVTSIVYGKDTENDYVVNVTVSDNSGVSVASLRDINSYTMDSKALPAGSIITLESAPDNATTRTAYIQIPKSAISETKDYKFLANGVADTAGNGVESHNEVAIKLRDTVAPKLNSAAVSSTDSAVLIVTFSENIKAESIQKEDLQFRINDKLVTPLTFEKVGSSTDKWYATFQKTDIDASASSGTQDLNANNINTITVKVKENEGTYTNSITDNEGNKITSFNEVSGK
ncbi:S-layer homology domain-containing protein [Paenibacillus albidus]|uniref:S-layer homology domain-containing protein n=1 Tax=Paenibacillus albidus TaxID=2041023 RepID=UPI001BE64BB5|nr:S-layer homology domain-containing protein [Paenibacillus albidus]MBT2288278.1 S-layer homology domain-containing protein [Paenibacillus albidus]